MKKLILYIQVVLLTSGIVFLFAFAQNKNEAQSIEEIEVEFLENQPTFLSIEMVNKLYQHEE